MANATTVTSPKTVATDTIVTQLRALEQLTRTEAQIARVRVAQARTDAVRRELRQNADNADRRSQRIAQQLRALDAVPDVVTPAIGRVLALVKSTLEQAQPIDEALLGDLTLEHQLLDRARYVRVLAERGGLPAVEKLADDLVTAHTATVDWLTTVLAEEALGGPAALTPTPLQRVAGGVTRAVVLPTRFAVQGVNRAVHTVYRTGESARETVEEVTGRVVQFGAGTREVAAASRDAALQRAERVAHREGADDVAETVHAARTDLGTLKASELPIPHYEEMTAQNAIAAIRELTTPDDIRAVIAFEENHKNRSGVVSAAQTRYAAIAKDRMGS
ncbi:ferritin-like domain-containing protein [Pseudonocardia nigra]|uniref:ferritin-like domain-containing protein n=1 Tax=Pseudonocardia nigra TaxID=1921578 RepID=UPI001C600A7A|nr:ferritin-like domain-containing protein [Pseudonocardia nigra]